MTPQVDSARATLPLLRRVDEACLRLEDEYLAGRRPDLEAVLAAFAEAERAVPLAEVLLLE